jgi:DNA-directed RNA polymerase subunit RPC12/RpoP
MIPIGNRHYCTVSGEAGKEEICEKCGSKFVYQLRRAARGECVNLLWVDNKGAADSAKEDAYKILENKLKDGFDVIACPTCGHIQSKMQRLFRSYVLRVGLCVCLLLSLPAIVLLSYWMDDFLFFKNQMQIGVIALLVPVVGFTIIMLLLKHPKTIGWMMRRGIPK